jgi:outer membrane protein TolC
MTKFLLIFFALLGINFSAIAQDYQISDLLKIAEENSANIKAADYQALAQKHFANQQKYWNNPSISYSSVSGQSVYSLTQPIPFYGKLQNKYDAQRAEFSIMETRRNITALLVKAEVFSLLYQYQAFKRKIELAEKRLNRLASVDKYLRYIALNSPTKKAQGYITKDRIRLIERDLIQYRNAAIQLWNRANVFLNLKNEPEKITLDWLDRSDYKGREFFINQAIENNLELKEQKFVLQKFKSELAFSKIEQMPDVNISLTQQQYSSSAQGANNKDGVGVGLSLSVPLLNRNQEKIASDQSKIKAQEFEVEFRTNQLIHLISNDINEFEISLEIAKKFPTQTIEQSLSHLNQANDDFKRGVLDFITYIELDLQEYEMINTVIDTQVQLANAYANLMTKIGNFTLPGNDR